MEWDTADYDTSLRRWPDPAQLAEALMAVPSLSDSLAAAQATSPARKRKLFGGTSSPGRAASKPSPSNNNAQSGRQLANLPSSKRARLSHSHPLSRSSVSPPRQPSHSTASLPHLLRHHSSHHPSTTSFRRSPSPVQATISRNIATYHTQSGSNNVALSQEERTCVSCRRTATSLLQLAKFHKCSLCGGLSCPICSRTCHVEGGAAGGEEDLEDSNGEDECPEDDHNHRSSAIDGTKRPGSIKLHDDSDESVNISDGHHYTQQSCGKPVCRGCCIESPDGTVQCYRCNNAAPPR